MAYLTGIASESWTDRWVYSNQVDVSAYRSLTFTHIQTPSETTALGYVFYDADGNYLWGATNGGISYAPIEKTINVPDGARFFRCMWMNTTHHQYEGNEEVFDISNFYCYGNP